DETHDVVVRAAEPEGGGANGDAFAGRGLGGDGDVVGGEGDARLQGDEAADVEDDGAGPDVVLHRFAQAARAGVVEVGDVDHLTAAAAPCEPAVALRPGEREMPRRE